MRIVVEGRIYNVFEHETFSDIFERYALDTKSLPDFFSLKDDSTILKDGLKLELHDARKFVRDISMKDTTEEVKKKVTEILSKFPSLDSSSIGNIWMNEIYENKEIDLKAEELLRKINRIAFTTIIKAKSSLERFRSYIASRLDFLKRNISSKDKIYKKLDSIEGTKTDPIIIQETSLSTSVHLPNKDTLLDIFDAIDTSLEVPFVVLFLKGKFYYKIYRYFSFFELPRISPQMGRDAWLEEEIIQDGLYYKVLSSKIELISSKQYYVPNLYSSVYWSLDNKVYVKIESHEGINEDEMRSRIFKIFGSRLDYSITTSSQVNVKCIFTVPNFLFDRAIFSDMIETNDLISNFLFLNEREKTALQKPHFFAYYQPLHSGEIELSWSVTIHPRFEEKPEIEVRISHAKNFQEADSIRIVLSKLLKVYQDNYDEVFNQYKAVIKTIKKVEFPKAKAKKKDSKTGVRTLNLRKVDPKMFSTGYGSVCHGKRQPYIVSTEEEATKLAKKLGNPHKVAYFQGSYYACEPREPDDIDKRMLWPGLVVNKPMKSMKNEKYAEAYPNLPCCFTTDQYEGKTNLRTYLEEEEGIGADIIGSTKKIGYIKGANKNINVGRYGAIPFLFEKMIDVDKGFERIPYKDKKIYPFIRYAVDFVPDSFFHCLEKAFNPKYSSELRSVNREKRIKNVKKVKAEIASKDFASAGQELYGFSKEKIIEMFYDPLTYLEPEMFITLAELYYECNIFLFVINDEFPDGEVVLPRHSQAYLRKKFNGNPSVIIFKAQTKKINIPYICSILCEIDSTTNTKIIDFVFENTRIVKLCKDATKHIGEVVVVTIEGTEIYKPLIDVR